MEHQTIIPETVRTLIYGQTRTFVDLLKVMNEDRPIKDYNEASGRLQDYLNRRHGRFGGEVANLACRLLQRWGETKQYADGIDFGELERVLMEKKAATYLVQTRADEVYYHYCIAKLIHYIQFLNEFRHYLGWGEIEADIETTLYRNPCGGFACGSFFLISQRMLWETMATLEKNWDKISDNGCLSNEKLEKVFFKDFQEMVDSFGLDQTLEKAYSYQGCHPDMLVPWRIVGPFLFKSPNGVYEIRCGSTPLLESSFEMRAASELLFKSKDFIHVSEYIVPVQDYSLPVYHRFRGKMHFATQEQKNEFINRLQTDYINNGY